MLHHYTQQDLVEAKALSGDIKSNYSCPRKTTTLEMLYVCLRLLYCLCFILFLYVV